jgi:hypothetical protein
MDPIPQQVCQHRRILEAPLLRQIIIQVQTIVTVVDSYIDQPFQQLIPLDIWMLLTTHKTVVSHHCAGPDSIVGRQFLSSVIEPERMSVPHGHVLDPFIGRIPQAWSGGDNTVGMDERYAVTIDGMTATVVGSIESVLGGVRHVDEDEFGMKATEMLLTFPLDAHTLISLQIKSIVLPIRNSPLTRNSVRNSTHPTRSLT